MAYATQQTLIETALKARGETLVKSGTRNCWTRQFLGRRDVNGNLVRVQSPRKRFWFTGKAGSLRLGSSQRDSTPCNDDVKQALIDEGKRILYPWNSPLKTA